MVRYGLFYSGGKHFVELDHFFKVSVDGKGQSAGIDSAILRNSCSLPEHPLRCNRGRRLEQDRPLTDLRVPFRLGGVSSLAAWNIEQGVRLHGRDCPPKL